MERTSVRSDITKGLMEKDYHHQRVDGIIKGLIRQKYVMYACGAC